MRLIDADALINVIERESNVDGAYGYMDTKSIIDVIDDVPTVEPERKKGKWVKGGEQPYFRKHFDIVVCSKCNKRGEHRWNFCPNCGADMRGGQNE